ncbi:MAG: hypothetical protein GY928_07290 [Colwellia sp.]|nr:hypothetical protein [Colwellia sp.]
MSSSPKLIFLFLVYFFGSENEKGVNGRRLPHWRNYYHTMIIILGGTLEGALEEGSKASPVSS